MDAASGEGTTYSSGAPEFTQGFFSFFLFAFLFFLMFFIVVIFYFYIQFRHCNSFTQQYKVRMTRSLVLCVVFCRSVFVLNLLVIMLSVLRRLTDSDYLFDFLKLFLYLLREIWNKVCWYLFEFWIKICLKEKKTVWYKLIMKKVWIYQRVIIWCKSKDRQYNCQKKTRLWNRCTKHSTGNLRLSNKKGVNLVLWKGRQFLNHYW